MEFFISTLLFGISVGGQYALIAIGYTMVYGILRLINFAHGDVFMVAGLLGIYLSATFPLYVAMPLVVILTVVLGFCIERVAYKPLRSAPRMSVMISAIGVSYLLQNTATYVTGGQPMIYPSLPFLSDTITVAGTSIKWVVLLTPVLVVALVILLTLLINRTKVGMAMRAVARDFETSQLMGIKINKVISVTFIIGSFLAAVGSLLYFTNYPTVIPTSGAMPGPGGHRRRAAVLLLSHPDAHHRLHARHQGLHRRRVRRHRLHPRRGDRRVPHRHLRELREDPAL